MNVGLRVRRNISLKVVGEFFARLLALLFFVAAARLLGDEKFGLYSFAYAFCALFMVVIDMGMNSIMIRDVAEDRVLASEYFGNIFLLKVILSVVAFILIWISINALGYTEQEVSLVIIAAPLIIGTGLMEFLNAAFSSLEKMGLEAFLKIINRLLILLLGLGAIFMGSGLFGMMRMMAVSYSVTVVFGLFLLYKTLKFLPKIDLLLWKKIFRKSLPLAVATLFTVIYFRIDVVMLSLMGSSNQEIGWYSAGIKLVDTLGVIPFLIVGGLFPVMSHLNSSDEKTFRKIFPIALQVLFFIGLGISAGGMMVSNPLSTLIFGRDFANTGQVFSILSWTIVFVFMNYLIIHTLIVAKAQVLISVASAIGVFVNISLNLLLIPRYSYIGAGIATVTTEAVIFILSLLFLLNAYKGRMKSPKGIIKALFSAGVMIGFLSLIKDMPLFLVITFGGAVYILVYIMIGGFSLSDIFGGVIENRN